MWMEVRQIYTYYIDFKIQVCAKLKLKKLLLYLFSASPAAYVTKFVWNSAKYSPRLTLKQICDAIAKVTNCNI